MKKTFLVLGLIIIAIIIWMATKPKPDANVPTATVSDVTTTADTSNTKPNETTQTATPATGAKQIDNANVKITFRGFGPDKIHNGSFGKIDSKLVANGDNITGEIIVDMNSLLADNVEKLTPHLKSADFFDVAKYPTATFKISSFKNGKISGVMTIHGVSKNVTVDVLSLETNPIRYSSTFNIDMKEFGINQKFANEVVEVTVIVPLK